MNTPIQMVDLKGQYARMQEEIDRAIIGTVRSGYFIGGREVDTFRQRLAEFNGSEHVIPCANGTDALQIALMALDLAPGDEVIVPAFTYVATAEVIALLGLTPIMIDVDEASYNVRSEDVAAAITPRTKAVIVVHLFGQSTDMAPILQLAEDRGIYVVEDNAQAIGATYQLSEQRRVKTGAMGHIGTTSFYPSKNLGAYGDGGALFTNDSALAARIRSMANHGQGDQRYYHELVGCNSRLDAIQAAILNVKLTYLPDYQAARNRAADQYDERLGHLEAVRIPYRHPRSTHVFHQYTLQVPASERDPLKTALQQKGIPTMIYYPVPLYRQQAFSRYWNGTPLPVTERLCQTVLSLPMHSELTEEVVDYVCDTVLAYFVPA